MATTGSVCDPIVAIAMATTSKYSILLSNCGQPIIYANKLQNKEY